MTSDLLSSGRWDVNWTRWSPPWSVAGWCHLGPAGSCAHNKLTLVVIQQSTVGETAPGHINNLRCLLLTVQCRATTVGGYDFTRFCKHLNIQQVFLCKVGEILNNSNNVGLSRPNPDVMLYTLYFVCTKHNQCTELLSSAVNCTSSLEFCIIYVIELLFSSMKYGQGLLNNNINSLCAIVCTNAQWCANVYILLDAITQSDSSIILRS